MLTEIKQKFMADIKFAMLNPQIENALKFQKLVDDYKGSNSETLFHLLQSNLFFKSILIKNFHDLSRTVQEHNKPEIDKRMWSNEDSGFRSRTQQKITRLMFNYLSAIFAYIDFSRVHTRSYLKQNAQVFEFAETNNPFKEHLAHRFVQALRNFNVHNKPVPITSELAMNIEWDAPRRSIYVDRNTLLKWSGWSDQAKQFMEKQNVKIYLFQILQEHFIEFTKYQLKVFRLLLTVSPSTTASFKNDINTIYDQASLIKSTGLLPFNGAFVRYINYQIKKAKQMEINDQLQHVSIGPGYTD
jgi:hypothetical protein